MNFDKEDSELIGWLESQGALIWDGMDQSGEAMFRFDLNILKNVFPPLYDEITSEIDEDLLELFKNEMIDLEYNENLEATFKLSEKGINFFKENPLPPFLN